jgi:hypothetical protein
VAGAPPKSIRRPRGFGRCHPQMDTHHSTGTRLRSSVAPPSPPCLARIDRTSGPGLSAKGDQHGEGSAISQCKREQPDRKLENALGWTRGLRREPFDGAHGPEHAEGLSRAAGADGAATRRPNRGRKRKQLKTPGTLAPAEFVRKDSRRPGGCDRGRGGGTDRPPRCLFTRSPDQQHQRAEGRLSAGDAQAGHRTVRRTTRGAGQPPALPAQRAARGGWARR